MRTDTDERLRAAVIGCGKIGASWDHDGGVQGVITHASAYEHCPATRLVAVHDVDLARANAAARDRSGVRPCDSIDLLASERPQIVSICTPDATHADVFAQVLSLPELKAILVEKPIALDVDAARKLLEVARRRHIIVAVNYGRRYSSRYRRLATEIREARYGTVQAVVGLYGKGTLHNGTHWFDLVRALVGEVASVRAHDLRGEPTEDPTLDVVLVLRDGAVGHLVSTDCKSYTVFELDILGSDGRLRFVDSGFAIEVYEAGPSRRFKDHRTLRRRARLSGRLDGSILTCVSDLARCVATGSNPMCTGEDGVAAIRIGMAARESAARDRWIDVTRD